MLGLVLRHTQRLESPIPPDAVKGLDGLQVAHEWLKRHGTVGLLVGGLAREACKLKYDQNFDSHKDVDVLVLTSEEGRTPKQWEAGVDWWTSSQLQQHPTNGPTYLLANARLAENANIAPGLYLIPRELLAKWIKIEKNLFPDKAVMEIPARTQPKISGFQVLKVKDLKWYWCKPSDPIAGKEGVEPTSETVQKEIIANEPSSTKPPMSCKEILKIPVGNRSYAIALSVAGEKIAVGDEGRVHILNATDGSLQRSISVGTKNYSMINHIQFDHDAIVAACSTDPVKFYDLKSEREKTFGASALKVFATYGEVGAWMGDEVARWWPSGRQVDRATLDPQSVWHDVCLEPIIHGLKSGNNGELVLWNSLNEEKVLEGGPFISGAFSHYHNTIVALEKPVGNAHRNVRVFSYPDCKPLASFATEAHVDQVILSREEKFAVVCNRGMGSELGRAFLLNLKTGENVQFETGGARVLDAATTYGDKVVLLLSDCTVRVFQVNA